MKNRQDVYAVGALTGLVVLFFHRALFSGQVYFHRDLGDLFLPFFSFAQEQLRAGHWPLWCPDILAGYPLLAEGQMGLFYPFNWLLLLPVAPYYLHKYVTVLHYLLAGLFTYLYGRRARLSPAPALFAAAVFTFSGFLVTKLVYPNMLSAAIWLPLLLWCLETALQTRRFLFGLLAGVVYAVQWLAGHPQISFYTGLTFSLYLLAAAVSAWRKEPSLRAAAYPLGLLALTGGLGGTLAAIQLLPSLELMGFTVRSAPDWAFITSGGFPPWQLVTLLRPNFFGTPVTNTDRGSWFLGDLCGFLSLLPLFLSWLGWRHPSGRIPRFLGLLAVFALAMAMARLNPLYRLLVHLPGANAFRLPVRYLYLFSLALALLSGFGLESLRSPSPRAAAARFLFRGLWAVGVLSLGASLAFSLGHELLRALGYWVVRPITGPGRGYDQGLDHYYARVDEMLQAQRQAPWGNADFLCLLVLCAAGMLLAWRLGQERLTVSHFTVAVFVLTVGDLFRFGLGFNPVIDTRFYTQPPATVQYLRRDPSLFRLFHWQTEPYEGRMMASYTHWGRDPEPFLRRREALPSDQPISWHVPIFSGMSPLDLQRRARYHAALLEPQPEAPALPDLRLFRAMGGKYLLTTVAVDHPEFEEVLVHEGLRLYEYRTPLPRCYLVPSYRVIPDPDQVLATLQHGPFDPRREVLLEISPPIPTALPDADAEAGSAKVESYGPLRVRITADAPHGGFLVLLDHHYPGWRAAVDGREGPVYRANYLFRAVYLPPGKHAMEFLFHSQAFALGSYLTLLSLLFGVAALVSIRRVRRAEKVVCTQARSSSGVPSPPRRRHSSER